ncbi:MAG: peptidoglycan editing factor PgeF [Myxococcales bacterium]
MNARAGTGLFVTSRLFESRGIVHGFTLRGGGVSQGPLASLNLSAAVGDAPGAVEENLARLGALAGLDPKLGLARVHQVHGDRIVAARASAGPQLAEVFAGSDPQAAAVSGERGAQGQPRESADALVALEAGTAVAVAVADCVPVLIGVEGVPAAAAIHSGWRGARLSIAARGVRALQQSAGAEPAQMIAAVGPSIGRCCYEVSAELATMFRGLFGPGAADDPAATSRPHLDLRFCVAASLRAAGIPDERIEQVPGCTSCDAASFFSHRRDRGRTGRHLAFVVA